MKQSRRGNITIAFVAAALVIVGSTSLTTGQDARQHTLGPALAGWEFVTDPAVPIAQVAAVQPDGVVRVSGTPIGYIATTGSHQDYRLHAEWRWSDKPGNGGALVHISSGPTDRQWPVCFQIQWKNKAVGDVLPMAGARFAEPLSTPAGAKTPQLNRQGADSERPVGEWNTCDITCRRDVIEVAINGVVQNRVTGVSVASGKVGFQLEGTPFELRNVSIAPLQSRGTEQAPPLRSPARFAYVGSFATSTRGAHGEGLSVYAIDAASGLWTRIQLLAKEINPGFLALHPRRQFLYSVHPVANEVSAFAIDDRTGELTLLNRQPSGGDDPSHLSVAPDGRFLVVANYVAGNIEVLPVNADGSLGAPTDLVATRGERGPHRTEQPGPHPHQCQFDPSGRFVVVPDKGFDRLFVFRIDSAKGTLVPADPPFTATRSGAGPRHIAFHPRLAYAWVVNELDSTIAAYRFGDTGRLDPIQIVPSLPSTYTGENTGAEIVVSPSGRFVYVSNRGHDSVGIFRVDESNGMLSAVGWEPTNGSTPRFIALDPTGTHLYAANQRSDSIVEFAVDATSGALRATGQVVKADTPVCVVFR